ncbi:DNA methylase [Pseudomonas sp. CES]|nr:DNA methylase [Pseudomonas sp. CES]
MLADEQGLDTPYKLSQATHATLVRLLGQAGYARYDESTARRLHALGKKADAELDVQLEALRDDPGCEGFKRWLLSFEGIGPKTVEIFMREALVYLSVSGSH